MKIRRATKKDAIKMNNLKKKTFEKINSKDYPKRVIKEYVSKQSPTKIIKNMKKGEYFVLVNKDKILGMIQLYDKNVLGGMYVRHDEIGKGYGKLLVNFIEDYAKKKGIKKLRLYSTTTARDFYKKLGYKRTNKKGYWEIAGYKCFDYEMEKVLK